MGLLIIMIVIGVICALIASSKGRNAVGWFFFGFFFGLVAIVVACIVSNLKEERARFEQSARERRRLREELKMERMRSQRAQGMTQQRLDIHDRALGIDTKTSTARAEIGTRPTGRIGAPKAAGAPPSWYYMVDGKDRFGPLPFAALSSAYLDGTFGPSDYVWKTGWDDWRRLEDVEGLMDALSS